MVNPRRALTRAQLLAQVWRYDFAGDARVLDTYVSYVRKKIDAHGPPLLHTSQHIRHSFAVYPGGHTVALWENEAPTWLGEALNALARERSAG